MMDNMIIEVEQNSDGTYILYDVQNNVEFECSTIDALLSAIEKILYSK